jgi:ribosomal protein L37AE/L43A
VRPEDTRALPPRDWERRVDDKIRGRAPSKDRDEGWYRPKTESREIEKKGSRDRFVCENCGNPSLQFFADGLGRCPGCGHRFRYSTRPTTLRSKQKHKQFVCSRCDSKNLQFFLDGTGLCPHCKREFKWRKGA